MLHGCLLLISCSSSVAQAPASDLALASDIAVLPDLTIIDRDKDGLDDAIELQWAAQYLPFISISPTDGCSTMGLLVRVRPHPLDKTLIQILYD